MKLVFLGTPEFAVPSLDALNAGRHEVALVVTQPDRPKGRGKRAQLPPVKLCAQNLGFHVAQPRKVSSEEGIELVKSLAPDAGVVCAYGEIISGTVLALAPEGFFNVHASLLPKFRGAAPVHHAILAGEAATGVTIIKLVEQMDAGDIVAAAQTPIAPGETTGQLTERLSRMGARLLVEALDRVEAGTAGFTPQDESRATYAPKVSKRDARIDWARDAEYLERFIRAMTPAPGAFTFLEHSGRTMRLIVGGAALARGTGEPGTVLESSRDRMVVAAGRGSAIQLMQVQPEGKRMMSTEEFLRGYRVAQGERFSIDG